MNVKEIFKEFIKNTNFQGNVKFDEEIAPFTTFKIGGKVSVLVFPEDAFQIQDVFALIKKYNIPHFILGGGSNVVFRDEFFDGVVISTLKLKGCSIAKSVDISEDSNPKENFVICASGTKMNDFVDFCVENDLWGAENFAGLPGTVGGAMFMNARCFEKSISEIFYRGIYYDLNNLERIEISYNSSDWGYKKSPFQNGNKFISTGIFKLNKKAKAEHEKLVQSATDFINQRKQKGHFDFPSAGSVFKNNHDFGEPSGKIIDECGLRGFTIGKAQVAPFHGNFIINLGGATQKDVKNLVEFVVNTVKEKKGFELEPEILFF